MSVIYTDQVHQLVSDDCYGLRVIIQADHRTRRRMKDGGSLELMIRGGEQMHRQERTCGISGDSETVNKTMKTITY